jgi:hypothetical protein
MAIDVLNGGCELRDWVDDPASSIADLEATTARDEAAWAAERRGVEIY